MSWGSSASFPFSPLIFTLTIFIFCFSINFFVIRPQLEEDLLRLKREGKGPETSPSLKTPETRRTQVFYLWGVPIATEHIGQMRALLMDLISRTVLHCLHIIVLVSSPPKTWSTKFLGAPFFSYTGKTRENTDVSKSQWGMCTRLNSEHCLNYNWMQ